MRLFMFHTLVGIMTGALIGIPTGSCYRASPTSHLPVGGEGRVHLFLPHDIVLYVVAAV